MSMLLCVGSLLAGSVCVGDEDAIEQDLEATQQGVFGIIVHGQNILSALLPTNLQKVAYLCRRTVFTLCDFRLLLRQGVS